MIRGAKLEAKKKNIPFDISAKDLSIPEVCPVLGIAIKVSENRPTDNSPSLDKIKPHLGYVKDNVRIISYRANRLKSDATLSEVLKLLEDASRYNY